MHLFGETLGSLVDGEDFLREDFGNVLVIIDLADEHQRFIDLEEVVEFVVILVHTKHAKIRFQILGGGDTVGLVGLAGNASAHFAYQAGHAHNGAAGQFLEFAYLMGAIAIDEAEKRLERMAADVKTKQLFFVGELLGIGPFGQIA